jgi:hypothetical protein
MKIEDEALRRRTVSMRLPQWVIDWLRVQQEQRFGVGDLVEHALVEHYQLSKEPKRLLRR